MKFKIHVFLYDMFLWILSSLYSKYYKLPTPSYYTSLDNCMKPYKVKTVMELGIKGNEHVESLLICANHSKPWVRVLLNLDLKILQTAANMFGQDDKRVYMDASMNLYYPKGNSKFNFEIIFFSIWNFSS